MSSRIRILVYGQDPTLLETRRMVLQHAGFEVTTALDLQKATAFLAAEEFAVFILCHSLSQANCESALAMAHLVHAKGKNLILSTALSGCSGGADDAILSAFADPRTLIERVKQLSTQPAP